VKRTFNNVILEKNDIDKKILKNLLGDEDYKDFKLELKTLKPRPCEKKVSITRKSIIFNNIEIV